MSEIKQAPLVAKMERVYREGGAHIATVWFEKPSEDRLPGESWLQMRERTEADRLRATQQTYDRARLFAAAPDLLEALQALDGLRGAFAPSDSEINEAWDKAEAAIAKATGQP